VSAVGSGLEQMYQQVILDHARERTGYGLRPGAVAESFQVNPTCGDQVTLRVHLLEGAARPTIESVSWEGHGCSISQASISAMAELVDGLDVAQADALTETFIALMHHRGQPLEPEREATLGDAAAFVGVARYPARVKCALLGWMALRDASARALTTIELTGLVAQPGDAGAADGLKETT
jgi:nitrogen fixation NifU-like protein